MITVNSTKTVNARRVSIIHKDIFDEVMTQLEGKSDDEHLFYHMDLSLKYRDEKVGKIINDIIRKVITYEKEKKSVDIASLRKNFSQELFLSDKFDTLSLKTLMGHTTKGDITDTHYLRGKRDYKSLKEKFDKVDFSHYSVK